MPARLTISKMAFCTTREAFVSIQPSAIHARAATMKREKPMTVVLGPRLLATSTTAMTVTTAAKPQQKHHEIH